MIDIEADLKPFPLESCDGETASGTPGTIDGHSCQPPGIIAGEIKNDMGRDISQISTGAKYPGFADPVDP